MTDAQLQGLATEKWKSSGLTDAQAKRMRLTPLTREQTARIGFGKALSLKIPYFQADGKMNGFYRIRYLEPPSGFAGQTKKPPRYMQPSGSLTHVYFCPLIKWAPYLKPEQALYITEGELKAAAGCARGLPVLGLGGVNSWQAYKRGMPLLPELAAIDWKSRPVAIIYDSDAAAKPQVAKAELKLAEALLERGALPKIVRLPPGDGDEKQGLDDFLLHATTEELNALVESTPVAQEALALWEMNNEVVYIRESGFVLERATNNIFAPGDFVSHRYANRKFTEEVPLANGGVKRREVSTAKRWIEWENRAELERVTYLPGGRQIAGGAWNMWRGWGVEPKPGSIKPWTEFLDYIFSSEPTARKWFEQWCAYPMQHPGVKLFTAAVMWSVHHGVGKTLIGYTLSDIYGANAIEIRNRDLASTFNEWAKAKQFVVGDEITGSEHAAETDRMKGRITQETVLVNEKFKPTYTMPDCINYFLTTQHPDAFKLDQSDRRFWIHEIVGKPMQPTTFYTEYYDGWRKREGGPSHLFHHLLHLDLTGFDPRAAAPMTTAKERMIADGRTSFADWCHRLREDPSALLLPLGARIAESCPVFTGAQLYRCIEGAQRFSTVGTLGRELKRAGFRQVNKGRHVRTSALGVQRFYAIRDEEKWLKATPQQIAGVVDEYWTAGKKKPKH